VNNGGIVRILVQNSAWLRVDAAMIGRIATALALALITATQVMAASPAEQRGKTFVLTNCARCHSIDRVSPSPLKIAPPFRTLHLRYPIETLGEALAEGISTSDHTGVSARPRSDP
jgi:cytochrome c